MNYAIVGQTREKRPLDQGLFSTLNMCFVTFEKTFGMGDELSQHIGTVSENVLACPIFL